MKQFQSRSLAGSVCLVSLVVCFLITQSTVANAQTKRNSSSNGCEFCPPPPPPPPAPGEFGGTYLNLTDALLKVFNAGYFEFNIKWDPAAGWGPVGTQNGCFSCHGSGVDVLTGIAGNTSGIMGRRYGKFNPDGTFNPLDGSGTFPENEGGPTLHGRSAAQFLPGCNLPHEVVPSDATVNNQVRSPQLFGLGLIDNIPESQIQANAVPQGMGIQGTANMVPDQFGNTHVGRFGQKSSIPNLLMFTAFAFWNEMGITNAYNPNKHLPQGQPIPPLCTNDTNSPNDVDGTDFVRTFLFNALLAPVTPQPTNSQIQAGLAVFESTGCNLCHFETYTTNPNVTLPVNLTGTTTEVVAPLSSVPVTLYSDLLLHDLGSGDSGGIPQGQATLTMWRTAPLWGLSTRESFGLMHDLASTDINSAILRHGGEASQVITLYQALSPDDEANLMAFLNSL
jgi:Di-haem oxidoreductase, putative peroxidase